MGYAFLSAALLMGAVKGYCGKRMGGYAQSMRSAVKMNFVRMLLCIVLGLGMVWQMGGQEQIRASGSLLGISFLSGLFTAVFVVSWLLAVRKSAYMLLDVFLMLGTLVPMLLGKTCFGEEIGLKRWMGYAVLLMAVLLLCTYSNAIKMRLKWSSFLLLFVSGAANGAVDFSQKLFVKTLPGQSAAVFNVYTYVFAAAVLGAALLVFPRAQETKAESGARSRYVYIAVMAAALILNSYFKTLAAARLSSAQLYPLNQGAGMILSSLMAHFLFRERLTRRAVIGITLAFAGLLIMNVL